MKALAVRAHALHEMLRLLRRRPGRFVLAMLLAASALALPLAGVSVALSIGPHADALPLRPQLSLFLAPTSSAPQIRQLQSRLAARPGVDRVQWITREAALESLAQRAEGTLAELKTSPLPDVLELTFAPGIDPAALQAAAAEMRALPGVESVAADTGWYRKAFALREAGKSAGALIAALVSASLASIAAAAVLLAATPSATELRVLEMVGADRGFIARPYVYAAALTLGIGAALAIALVWIGLVALGAPVAELARLYQQPLSLSLPSAKWLIGLAGGAALIGGAIGAIAVRVALRRLRRPTAGA